MSTRFDILLYNRDNSMGEAVKALILKEFPEVNVTVVGTPVGVEIAIKSASKFGIVVDAVVIDSNEIESDLCGTINYLLPNELVIHIPTAEESDPNILRHLANLHCAPGCAKSIFISKANPNWTETLIKKLKGYLWGEEIRRKMDNLFVNGSGCRHGYFR